MIYWLAWIRYWLTWLDPDEDDSGTWYPVQPDGGPPKGHLN